MGCVFQAGVGRQGKDRGSHKCDSFFKLWSKRPGKVGAGAAGSMLTGIPLG